MNLTAIVSGLELLALRDVHLTSAEHPAPGSLCVQELVDEMFEGDAWVATYTRGVAEHRIERLRIALILYTDDASTGRITDSPCDHGQSDDDAKSFHEPIHDSRAGHKCLLVAFALRTTVS
jgi:hypothetical protein